MGRKGKPGGPGRPLAEWTISRSTWHYSPHCSALLSKMASSSELLEYSSPVKRRRIDGGEHEVKAVTTLEEPRLAETPCDSPHDELEGIERLAERIIRDWSRLSRNSRVPLTRKMAAIERFSSRHYVLGPSIASSGRHDSHV